MDLKDNDAPEIGFSGMMDWIQNFNVLGVTFDCTLNDAGIDVMVSFDKEVDRAEEIQKIVLRFESLVHQLVSKEGMQDVSVNELEILSDMQLLDVSKEARILIEERDVKKKE